MMILKKIFTPPSVYELESLHDEIKRIITKEGHFTEAEYPFTVKPNFSTLGSNIEISRQGPFITFLPNDSIRNLLGFNAVTLYKQYKLSLNPVDSLSFDYIFLETDVVQEMIFRGKRSRTIHKFTLDVDPGCRYIEKTAEGISWYMMASKDFISSICFEIPKRK